MGTSFAVAEFKRRTSVSGPALPNVTSFIKAVDAVMTLVPWPHRDLEWEIVASGNDLHLHGVLSPNRHLMLTCPAPFDAFTVSLFRSEKKADGKVVVDLLAPLATETVMANETDLLGALSVTVGAHRETAWEDGAFFVPWRAARAATFRCCLVDDEVELREGARLWESPTGKTAFVPAQAAGLVAVGPKGFQKLVLHEFWLNFQADALGPAKTDGTLVPDGMALPLPPDERTA